MVLRSNIPYKRVLFAWESATKNVDCHNEAHYEAVLSGRKRELIDATGFLEGGIMGISLRNMSRNRFLGMDDWCRNQQTGAILLFV